MGFVALSFCVEEEHLPVFVHTMGSWTLRPSCSIRKYRGMLYLSRSSSGRVAQLGERVLCKHEVAGSIPVTSTKTLTISLAWTRSVGAGLRLV